MSYISRGVIQFGDSASIDPFGRARVSNTYTLFDSKQLFDNGPLQWNDTQTSGSGTTSTFSANRASSMLATTNSTAGTRVRQTKRRFNYQPGKGQLIFITFDAEATPSGNTKRIGYFDDSNGIFLQITGTGISVVRRTNITGTPTDNAVAQASWNLDPLNGNGPSGITLDSSASQILMIDMEWLGVGRVRCAIVIDGTPIYFHQFVWANSNHGVYMSTPNLPVRYEISNNGTGAASSLECICSSVMSEGGREENGIMFAIDRGATGLATGNDTNLYPVLGMRLNSAKLGGTARMHSISIMSTTTTAARWGIFLNPTIAGTALTWSAVTNSIVDISNTSTNASTISAEGTFLYGGYINQSTTGDFYTQIPINLFLGSTIAGVSDQLILGISRVNGTGETFFATMNWIEG